MSLDIDVVFNKNNWVRHGTEKQNVKNYPGLFESSLVNKGTEI